MKDIAPPNRIRVETALSRYPIHCLSRKGTVTIDLQHVNEDGVIDTKWEVTFNSKHGQPGPLAYKVDTLIVNRLLDQMGRPLPELVRIGSLSDVCRALGTQDTGPNIASLKSAFLQNASAFINARMRYKTKGGREKWAEIGYTRYSVVFTGEMLPDGSQADAVHILLNPPYREFLNHVETRPLDYDYLKKLPPGPQRLYELLSFQIYGAIAGARSRAKLLYSDYCKYAPQVRYGDFDHVKKQMWKLHQLHREAGYIVKIEYEETADGDGKADWEMFYTPGPKAFTEYKAFTNRQALNPALNISEQPKSLEYHRKPAQAGLAFGEVDERLFAELTRRGIADAKARALLTSLKPGQEVMDQLEYVDFLVARDRRSKLDNPPGLYIYYVRDNIAPPAEFWSSRKAKLDEQAQQARNEEMARQARLEIAYEEYRTSEIQAFVEGLAEDEYRALFDEQLHFCRGLFRSMTPDQLDDAAHRAVRGALANSGRVPFLSFEEFRRKHSVLI